jgi:cell division protein FtsL
MKGKGDFIDKAFKFSRVIYLIFIIAFLVLVILRIFKII